MNKFTQGDLNRAGARLKMLAFYPSDPEAHAAIMELLGIMCPHREALVWLVDAMVNRVGKWLGPMELRGVLCTRYKPADDIEVNSSVVGFRPEDGERISMERALSIERTPIVESSRKLLPPAKRLGPRGAA